MEYVETFNNRFYKINQCSLFYQFRDATAFRTIAEFQSFSFYDFENCSVKERPCMYTRIQF